MVIDLYQFEKRFPADEKMETEAFLSLYTSKSSVDKMNGSAADRSTAEVESSLFPTRRKLRTQSR
jgi:hypothetical protein